MKNTKPSVRLYAGPDNTSMQKTISYLQANSIQYTVKNVRKHGVTPDEIRRLFRTCENGVTDVISMRSREWKNIADTAEEMTMNQLIAYICEHPNVLRYPIITDGKRMLVGYDSDEITIFKPRSGRKASVNVC